MLQTVRSKFSVTSPWKRAFVVTFVFVTLASGLFWLDFFRGYSAEVTVLIVSKTETASMSQDVAEDVAELVRTLAFYDRVIAGNDLIDDAFEGYAPDKRKALWNDTVSVKHPAGSGTLIVLAQGDTQEIAKRLARETAQTMFSVAGFYYNVKTDIDMRIIDGPIASAILTRPILFGVTSILSGFSVTLLFFFLLNAVPGLIGGRKKKALLPDTHMAPEKAYPEFAIGETVSWIDPRKFIPAKPSTLSFQETKETHLTPAPRSVAHAPAPANLPIADTETESPLADDDAAFPFEFETSPEESEEMFPENQEEILSSFPVRGEHNISQSSIVPQASEPASADANLSEPTVDEYKRRLNELLSGSK